MPASVACVRSRVGLPGRSRTFSFHRHLSIITAVGAGRCRARTDQALSADRGDPGGHRVSPRGRLAGRDSLGSRSGRGRKCIEPGDAGVVGGRSRMGKACNVFPGRWLGRRGPGSASRGPADRTRGGRRGQRRSGRGPAGQKGSAARGCPDVLDSVFHADSEPVRRVDRLRIGSCAGSGLVIRQDAGRQGSIRLSP